MLHVCLHITHLTLHISQPVTLQLHIRKPPHFLTIPLSFPLINCQANINTTFQFLMKSNPPTFELCVVLCRQYKRKFAGSLHFDLSKHKFQQSIIVQTKLDQCPDHKSMIQLNISYAKSKQNYFTLQLVSHEDTKTMKLMMQRSVVQEEEKLVVQKSKILEDHHAHLTRINHELYNELEKLEEQQAEEQFSWKEQLEEQQFRNRSIRGELERQKLKMAAILDAVLQCGDAELLELVQETIEAGGRNVMEGEEDITDS